VNRMVFGTAAGGQAEEDPPDETAALRFRLPLSCSIALLLAAIPVIALGVYIPPPLDELLKQAAAALNR